MVAHAGIAEPRPLLETDDELWRRHIAINVDGVFYCVREAARAMVQRGRGGAIVCTASINAWHVEETMAAYNVSKAAVQALARSAAIDLGRHRIRVNAVAPGVVDTPIAELVVHNPTLAPAYLRTIPLGRFGKPRDIADAVLFLASDEASYITGQMLVIDGGQTLGITGDLETAADEGGPEMSTDRHTGRALVLERYSDQIGRARDEVTTPALLLDLDVAKRNIAAMADAFAELPASSAPHQGPQVDRARADDVDAGAVGVACATAWEAIVMARGGIEDVLVANQVVRPTRSPRCRARARAPNHADRRRRPQRRAAVAGGSRAPVRSSNC